MGGREVQSWGRRVEGKSFEMDFAEATENRSGSMQERMQRFENVGGIHSSDLNDTDPAPAAAMAYGGDLEGNAPVETAGATNGSTGSGGQRMRKFVPPPEKQKFRRTYQIEDPNFKPTVFEDNAEKHLEVSI